MAVADLISAWLPSFIAPIILYFAGQYAFRKGWLSAPSTPSDEITHQSLDVLREVHGVLQDIKTDITRHREGSAESLRDIKGSLDRLKELGEARERDGGMLIYQRVPLPHVPSAAAHLDG